MQLPTLQPRWGHAFPLSRHTSAPSSSRPPRGAPVGKARGKQRRAGGACAQRGGPERRGPGASASRVRRRKTNARGSRRGFSGAFSQVAREGQPWPEAGECELKPGLGGRPAGRAREAAATQAGPGRSREAGRARLGRGPTGDPDPCCYATGGVVTRQREARVSWEPRVPRLLGDRRRRGAVRLGDKASAERLAPDPRPRPPRPSLGRPRSEPFGVP